MGAGGIYGIEPEYRFVCSSWNAGELEDAVVLGDFDSGCGRVGGCCDSVDGADESLSYPCVMLCIIFRWLDSATP